MDNMQNNGPDLSQNNQQQNTQQVPPQYNQQVPPQYNQQVPPQYNQQVPPQNGQQVPPQFNQTINVQVPPPGYAPKSKMAAGLLGIFLGWLGIHNFYLGYTGKAVAQLILGIFSCGTISGIWGLIEGILILTGSIAVDGNGVPLQQ